MTLLFLVSGSRSLLHFIKAKEWNGFLKIQVHCKYSQVNVMG